MPTFSIIMACHNAENYVESAISSALKQTYSDFELIIVDDCSTDKSAAVIKKYLSIDSRVKAIFLERNAGAAAARNIAIESSSGQWLAILDADDVYFPDKLEKQINTLRSRENIVLSATGCVHITHDDKQLSKYHYATNSRRLKKNLHKNKKFPPHSSLVYRADTVKKIGGFNENFFSAEDYDLWLRLSDYGDFICEKEVLVKYRTHNYNISNARSNNGHTLIEYSVAALVCYWLRNTYKSDPSAINGSEEFNKLMKEISIEIKKSHYYQSIELITKIKQTLKGDIKLIKKFIIIIKLIILSPIEFIKVLNVLIYGNKLKNLCINILFLKK